MKGAPPMQKSSNNKRRCSNCSLPGYTKRNCPTPNSRKVMVSDDISSGCGSEAEEDRDLDCTPTE